MELYLVKYGSPGEDSTYTLYDPAKLVTQPLSILQPFNQIFIKNAPTDFTEPIQMIANWFESNGTSFYNWVHDEPNYREFTVLFSNKTLPEPFKCSVNLKRNTPGALVIAIMPWNMHYSNFAYLETLIGSTSSGFHEGLDINILEPMTSEKNVAYLRLTSIKRIKLRGPYWAGLADP